MYPQTHIAIGLLFVVLLGIFTPLSPIALFIIFCVSILIDVDHWFIYVQTTRKLGIKGSYDWFVRLHHKRVAAKKRNPHVILPKFLCVFHTIEFYLLIVILSFYYPFFFYVLMGVTFHELLDAISDVREKDNSKYLSIIYYLIKK